VALSSSISNTRMPSALTTCGWNISPHRVNKASIL
jgi:hypothetical protein